MLDALVLDASLRQGLVTVRALGRAGHRVGAVEVAGGGPVPAFASRWCTSSARTCGPSGSDRDVDALLALLDHRPADVVIPSHDGTIEAIRRRRDQIERRARVALAGETALAAAVDKTVTLRVADRLGVRVPRSVPVPSVASVCRAVDEVGLPAVVRPMRSWVPGRHAPRRLLVTMATSVAEARHQVDEMLQQGADVVLQELVRGPREAVSFVYAGGRFHGEFAQRADRTLPVLGGSSVWRQSIPLPPDLVADARAVVGELGLEGYSEVEFRRDDDGRPVLMEINPRLSASVELAVRAGVDFPQLVLRWARGERLPVATPYRSGVRMRWLGGEVAWLRETWRTRGAPLVESRPGALYQLAVSSVRPTSYDYLDAEDLLPVLAAATRGTVAVVRRSGDRVARSWRGA